MKIITKCSAEDIFKNKSYWGDTIKQCIDNGGGCVIRGIYDENFVLGFRRWVFEERLKQGYSRNQKYTKSTRNHFKVVDKKFDDTRPTRFVLHQFFPWNKSDNSKFHELFIQFMRIRNILNGLDVEVGISDLKKFISWISVLHYRSGGDFLSSHRDAYKFQAILIMSEIGRDFSSGGQYILNEKSGSTFTEKQLKVGDLVMLKSDIYHGVYPIDQDSVLADNSINGRWIMFSPYHDPSVLC